MRQLLGFAFLLAALQTGSSPSFAQNIFGKSIVADTRWQTKNCDGFRCHKSAVYRFGSKFYIGKNGKRIFEYSQKKGGTLYKVGVQKKGDVVFHIKGNSLIYTWSDSDVIVINTVRVTGRTCRDTRKFKQKPTGNFPNRISTSIIVSQKCTVSDGNIFK